MGYSLLRDLGGYVSKYEDLDGNIQVLTSWEVCIKKSLIIIFLLNYKLFIFSFNFMCILHMPTF